MLRRYGSFFFWIIGALIIIAGFYAATARLWKATEEARAASLEKDIVSSAMGDIAEGNLIRFGSTLSKLQREGQIRFAEIRHIGSDSGVLFQTAGDDSSNDARLADFNCQSAHRFFDAPDGGIGLITMLPTKIAGGQCDVLLLAADMPPDLRRFKDRLLSMLAVFVVAIFGFFSLITILWHRRVLKLEVQNRLIHAERDAAIGRVASQVAHDIRSPLAALDSVLNDLSQLPEEKRITIRSAAGRIRDIANNLIDKSRTAGRDGSGSAATESRTAAEPASAQLLSSLVDSLITEKRLQFRSQIGVEIDSRIDESSYGLFVDIEPSGLTRVLSNLINNAVEALPAKGLVTVRLASYEESIEIEVRDNGKGIPPDDLARLGQRGETHGKLGGTGLGLHHAKTSIESWGGSLRIDSDLGKGTTVTIRLPRGRAPEWFVSGLKITPGATIVVLDDDTSIHQVWRGRFEAARVKNHGVEVLHFSTPAELRSWAQTGARTAKNTLYLMDFELLGYSETGLSLAEELGIGDRTILVTSRFDEKGILSESIRLNARLIPKALAGFVPISVAEVPSRGRFDAVLIDDDPLVRRNWQIAAANAGKKLKAYSSAAEFFKDAESIHRETPVYVDSKLGNGSRGEDESRRIHSMGFAEIYLATGRDAAEFSGLSHLRGVVGKGSPWTH
jgi:signal transduction histidine kinase